MDSPTEPLVECDDVNCDNPYSVTVPGGLLQQENLINDDALSN